MGGSGGASGATGDETKRKRTVSPRSMVSPSWSSVRWLMRWPLTNVPFVLPMSSTA